MLLQPSDTMLCCVQGQTSVDMVSDDNCSLKPRLRLSAQLVGSDYRAILSPEIPLVSEIFGEVFREVCQRSLMLNIGLLWHSYKEQRDMAMT